MTISRTLGAVSVAAAIALVMACSPSSRDYGAAVTLTGCLQPGDSPGTFRLTSTGEPNSATGTSGSSQPSGDLNNPTGTSSKSNSSDIGAATTKVYTLVPGRNVDLDKNQGTLVRITGRFDNGRSSTGTSGPSEQNRKPATDQSQKNSSANAATGEGPQSSTQDQAANRQTATIHVDSVEQVAGTCGGASNR